jgi:hypothetical protein
MAVIYLFNENKFDNLCLIIPVFTLICQPFKLYLSL